MVPADALVKVPITIGVIGNTPLALDNWAVKTLPIPKEVLAVKVIAIACPAQNGLPTMLEVVISGVDGGTTSKLAILIMLHFPFASRTRV